MLIHASEDVSKYQFTGEISTKSVVEFVEKFNAGSLTKFLKTEEIPATQEGPVKVLVGKSF